MTKDGVPDGDRHLLRESPPSVPRCVVAHEPAAYQVVDIEFRCEHPAPVIIRSQSGDLECVEQPHERRSEIADGAQHGQGLVRHLSIPDTRPSDVDVDDRSESPQHLRMRPQHGSEQLGRDGSYAGGAWERCGGHETVNRAIETHARRAGSGASAHDPTGGKVTPEGNPRGSVRLVGGAEGGVFRDHDTGHPRRRAERRLHPLADESREVFAGRHELAVGKFGDIEIDVAMVEPIAHFAMEHGIKPREVYRETGNGIDRSRDGDIAHVAVTMEACP